MAELDRAERLAAFLAQAARIPFSYETGHDCAQGLVAGWVTQETGRDAAALWRGRYRTALGCFRMVRREGGLVAVMSRTAETVGLIRTEAPKLGDVGAVLVMTPNGVEPVGAIRGANCWTMLTARGVRGSTRSQCLAAWSIP